ncbi:MAG: hypothetical protein V7720_04230 [Halioglobus sp.]
MAEAAAGQQATFATSISDLPEVGQHFLALYRSFWSLESLPAETLELCRLRLAQLLESDIAWEHEEVALTSMQRDQLRRWPDSAVFSAAQRACLELTEMHAMDARAITDEQADAVKAHYGEVGFVALVQALGVFDATIRLGLIWGLTSMEVDQ